MTWDITGVHQPANRWGNRATERKRAVLFSDKALIVHRDLLSSSLV